MALLLERAVLVLAILSLALAIPPLVTHAATRVRHVSKDKAVEVKFKQLAPDDLLAIGYLSDDDTHFYESFTGHYQLSSYVGPPTGCVLPVGMGTAGPAPWWGPTSTTLGVSNSGSAGNSPTSGNATAALGGASAMGGKLPPHVELRALWPKAVPHGAWQPLHIYVYDGINGYSGARTDFLDRMDVPEYGVSADQAEIACGLDIDVVPDVAGLSFMPPRVRVPWAGDWQYCRFDFLGDKPCAATGRVMFFVGPVLVGETLLIVDVTDAHEIGVMTESVAFPHEAVFISYAREDSAIAEALEQAQRALGLMPLRDVNILKSGEEWRPAVRQLIDGARLFQLCWSSAAKQSPHVAEEWKYALSLRRSHFIRPVYWERPMPECPAELQHINFALYSVQNHLGDAG